MAHSNFNLLKLPARSIQHILHNRLHKSKENDCLSYRRVCNPWDLSLSLLLGHPRHHLSRLLHFCIQHKTVSTSRLERHLDLARYQHPVFGPRKKSALGWSKLCAINDRKRRPRSIISSTLSSIRYSSNIQIQFQIWKIITTRATRLRSPTNYRVGWSQGSSHITACITRYDVQYYIVVLPYLKKRTRRNTVTKVKSSQVK